MREILFKAKRVDNGKEVKGSLVVLKDKCFIFIETKPSKVKKLSRITHKLIAECVEVIPETVRQFTGLKDRKGKRIFEGDILSCWYDEISKNIRQTVKVFFEKGQFVIDHYAIKTLFDRNTNCEIIGNIHDNIELLEVDE